MTDRHVSVSRSDGGSPGSLPAQHIPAKHTIISYLHRPWRYLTIMKRLTSSKLQGEWVCLSRDESANAVDSVLE